MNRRIRLAAAAALLAFAPLALFAASQPQSGETPIKFRGQYIYVNLSGKPEVHYLPDGADGDTPDAELVLAYTNSANTSGNTLRTDLSIEARLLLVGGGGAGGYGNTGGTYPGGGGGGGEVKELPNAGYSADTYSIIVGAGAPRTTASGKGANGQPSSFTVGGTTHTALGGGGGGSRSDGYGGTDVATGGGGGGQIKTGVFGQGGQGLLFKGGNAVNNNNGGGGAGAGGDGTNATTTVAGAGGVGVGSDIWPDNSGNPRRFGGGGGGAKNNATTGFGVGIDGGGDGGRQGVQGEDGTVNTGGGGGGGGRQTSGTTGAIGGAGGSGIVIIRITYIELPMNWIPIPVSAGGHDGKIFVDENAATNWVNGDLVITYTNTSRRGGLRFFNPDEPSLPPVWAQASVLVVGGGGGGGLITTRGDYGAGGGGGAGGFVPLEGLMFDTNLVFAIEVGKGGAGGDTDGTAGTDGGSSFILTNDNKMVEAYGGGGGGARCAGHDGGSGGGGSFNWPTVMPGGAGVAGQGFAGGSGISGTTDSAAGGGGAGGPGQDAFSTGGGSKGGEGRKSIISGKELWYAGGGGGAYINPTSAGVVKYFGGDGGSFDALANRHVGGNGAGVDGGSTGKELNPIPAQDGMDGRGGGGGGGTSHENATSPAGRGGSGVVIIRLSNFIVKNIPVPVPQGPFVYDGNVHTGVVEFFAYELTGTPIATNANVYAVTATLKDIYPDITWGDAAGGRAPRKLTWEINPLVVDVPTWGTHETRENYFTFGTQGRDNEEEKLAIDKNLWDLGKDRPGYLGETCATNKLPYCTLKGHRETNAGEYHFTATLVTTDPQGNFATNFVWRTAPSGKGRTDPWSVAWEIETAANAILSLSLESWQEDTTNKVPVSEWTWRKVMERYPEHYPHEDVVTYEWRLKGSSEPWDNTKLKPVDELVLPTEAGVYELRAFICKDSNHEPGNWEAAENFTTFFVWRHPSKTLSDWVDIQVTGCHLLTSGSGLTDFPVLVRLKEPVPDVSTDAIVDGLPGFRYADVRRNGLELRFISVSNLTDSAVAPCDRGNPLAYDTLLPFEIDTWNPEGESLVWVKVPKMWKKAKFRMYWRRRDGAELYDDIKPSEVWANGYVGVWHFGETISAEDAPTARSADSSGNGHDAVPAGGASANLATMTSVPGMIGNARQNETHYIKAGGNSLRLTGTEGFDFAGKMTMSTWIKINGYTASTYPRVFSSKLNYAGAVGFEMELTSKIAATFRAAGNTGSRILSTKTIFNTDAPKAGWANVTFRINGTGTNNGKYYSYLPGYPTGYNGQGTLDALQPSADAIHLGSDPGFQQPGVWGFYDETRLSNVSRSDDWVKAEFESVNNAKYCTFGLVNQLQGTSGGTDARAWVNWWSAEPWAAARSVPGTEGGRYWRQPPNTPHLPDPQTVTNTYFGALAYVYNDTGATPPSSKPVGTVQATYTAMPSRERVVFPTEQGAYEIAFTMANLEAGTMDYPGQHVIYTGDRKVDIEIVEDKPTPIDPEGGGSDAVNLRVLLGNDDVDGRSEGNAVSNQSYFAWEHRDRHLPPTVMTNVTAAGLAVMTNNLLPGLSHTLTNAQGRAQWTLDSVYLGNMMTADPDAAAPLLLDGQLSLNWSPSSRNSSTNAATYLEPLDRRWVGQMVLRNLGAEPDDSADDALGASIRSPWYTNGVGTVYFDAVNAYTTNAAAFKLQVEVSTNAFDNLTPSTRSNVVWTCVKNIIQMKYADGSFGKPETNDQATLVHPGTGIGSFSRILAPVNLREPCRIRIRRVSMLGEDGEADPDDWHGFIVVDNVIVSWPTESARIGPLGWYDARKTGKQVLGWETAFSEDYPAAAVSNLYARAGHLGRPGVAASARCHYRWRYLDAAFLPERVRTATGFRDDFRTVYLDPANGFRGIDPLELPGIAGDLEYWFDLTAIIPYYGYVDYSGWSIEKPTGDYTENPEKGVTCRRATGEGPLPSRGTDWFIRLREGESDYESTRAYFSYTQKDDYGRTVKKTAEVDLFPVENHLWRGYLRTAKEMAGGLASYRLEMRRASAPGSTVPRLETEYLVASDGLKKPEDIPGSPMLRPAESNETAEVYIDAATGALMLQLDDRSKSLTLSHADYQDFNGWSDAVSHEINPLFTGSSIEGPKKKGVSSKSVRLAEAFDRWTDTPETKGWWQEPFAGTIDEGRPGFVPFATDTTPNGWEANNGQWVAKFYHPVDATSRTQSGLALELFGAQNGYLRVPALVEEPRGLGTVKFSARIAQTIDFYDFCTSGSEDNMSNYTFLVRSTFDVNRNTNFAGNASLSLVAFYSENHRQGIGCYEARWEQLKGDYNTTSKSFTRPALNSHRLSLYRWMKDTSGEIKATLLGSYDIGVFNIPETNGKGGNYMPFFISASTDPVSSNTTVSAGVLRKNGGIGAKAALSGNWTCVNYVDSTPGHPKGGAYGVLSANCEGVFLRPTKYGAKATVSGTAPSPGKFEKLDNKAVTFNGGVHECEDDLYWKWAIDGVRMIDFYETDEELWGLKAPTPSATLNLMLSPRGKEEWTVAGTRTVTGFGTNAQAGKPDEFIVRDVADKSIRLSVSGSALADVVLTDVEFTQWRGDSYGEGDTLPFAAGEKAYGYPSNVVFTSGIVVTNETDGFAHKVRLSARRTQTGRPASVRSPFFDGEVNLDGTRRGLGLGMIAFSYENAQANVNLLVQIATNLSAGADVTEITRSVETNMAWTTVTNFDFSTCSALDRRKGVRTVYLGLHGVVGLMRIVLDPALVESVQAARGSDEDLFGEIDITKFVVRDEPPLEAADWWGWNVRTVESVTNGVDDVLRTYLPDGDIDAEGKGLPIALNCSITEYVHPEDTEDLKEHMPFVQTPTFTNNIVGEVSFRARRYDNGESSQYAEVQLYGAYSGQEGDDTKWQPLHRFVVSNTTYEAYSFRSAGSFSAFRLAVTGVKDVKYPGEPRAYDPAVRVLIDEVSVFEAVNPAMGFRYVYPFRDGMDETTACTNVVDAAGLPLPDAQPLCGEGWTVQAEIMKTKLPDEIDMTVNPPRVLFHWFVGNYPWGYNKWRDLPASEGRHSAELALADGETMVFRGSLAKAREAIVAATPTGPMVVQYAADIIYHTVGGIELTNSLVRNATTTWTRPSWYAPVDYNAGKAAVAAYTIIDSIAPHRVWINEVNLWDGRSAGFVEYADTNQYIEVAAPQLQSLEGWRIEYISNDRQTVETLVRFTDSDTGDGYAPPLKDLKKAPAAKLDEYRTNDYVFLAVQSPKTRNSRTWDGVPAAIDGTWRDFKGDGGILDQKEPIAIRLIRPSQIVEHEIVLEGTNRWEYGRHPDRDNPTNWIAQVERDILGRKSNLFYVGNEDPNTDRQSIGVIRNTGAVSNDWKNLMVQTPGRVNEGQIVPYGYVLYPNGELMVVRAQIGSTGHILQTLADETNTASEVTLMIRKGGEGTNITYRVADWWETAFVTTNGQMIVEATGRRGTFTVNVGAGQSNDVTVVAMAQPMSELRDRYGLTEDNPYTPAVMDWLEGGKNFFGEEFEHPGDIHLAEYRTPITYTYITNLDLTAMYWLDIDPTTNWVLKGGVVASRHGGIQPIILDDPPPAVTNFRMGVHMEITNEMTGVAYAPYVLRGLAPGQTSADYKGNWDSVNFKITGDIQISDPAYAGRERWIPLRWFVFKPKPGATSRVGASASFGDDFRSTVDVWDPKDESAAIYTQGWSQFPDALIFYRWALDGRNAPVTIETLLPESTYSE